jgi:prephenate dehydratase
MAAHSLDSVTKARRVGYFGPAGTFTEQALVTQPDLAALERVPLRTVPDVLDAVAANEVDLGFVPIENSIEGTVNFTQDALVFDHDLLIQREVVLDIEHCLVVRPGTTLGDIKVVLSIPVATAQCHAYLRQSLRDVDVQSRRPMPQVSTGSRCWSATSPITRATKHALCWWAINRFRPARGTIKQVSWCFSELMNQAV